MIGVKQTGGNGGGSASQDNIAIFRNYRTGGRGTLPLLVQLNNGLQFEISEVQSLWIEVSAFRPSANDMGGSVSREVYKIANLGKGTYGIGGTQVIEANDLKLISASQLVTLDIEDLASTQKIFIADLGGKTIRQFVNDANPAYNLQNPSDGAVLFKVGNAPDYVSYWFIGDGGEYGFGKLQAEDIDFQLLEEVATIVANPNHRILIQSKEQLLGNFRSDVVYVVDGDFEFVAGEYITLTGNTTLDGWGFDISRLRKNVAGESLFKSAVAGSRNLSINKLEINSGASSVFDNFDSDGTHSVEMNDVNFQNCSSLGRLKGYRQFTGTTLGFYSCGTGIQFSGTWNGFKLTNTNCFSFGNGGTFFRKDVDTLFKNRFFAELNADFPLGSKLADFVESNFQSDELFQMNSSMIKYNGTINDKNASFLVPSLSANNRKCLWRSNVGLPDTALEKIIEDSNVSVSYVVSWLYDTYDLTMTGNTIFAETNLPASGKNTEEIKIYLQGNFTPTFPSAWNANRVGTFKIGELNQITLKYLKSGKYFMKIDNSLSVYPAPDVSSVSPALKPNETGLLNVYGSFFTPQSIVSISGHIVNSVKFINQGHLELSVQTSILEGDFDLTVSNGTQIVKSGIVNVYLGIVFIPKESDYINVVEPIDLSVNGEIKTKIYGSTGSAKLDPLKATILGSTNFRIYFELGQSPLGTIGADAYHDVFKLHRVSDNVAVYRVKFYKANEAYASMLIDSTPSLNVTNGMYDGNAGGNISNGQFLKFYLERKNGVFSIYRNGVFLTNIAFVEPSDMFVTFNVNRRDYRGFKYVQI